MKNYKRIKLYCILADITGVVFACFSIMTVACLLWVVAGIVFLAARYSEKKSGTNKSQNNNRYTATTWYYMNQQNNSD